MTNSEIMFKLLGFPTKEIHIDTKEEVQKLIDSKSCMTGYYHFPCIQIGAVEILGGTFAERCAICGYEVPPTRETTIEEIKENIENNVTLILMKDIIVVMADEGKYYQCEGDPNYTLPVETDLSEIIDDVEINDLR